MWLFYISTVSALVITQTPSFIAMIRLVSNLFILAIGEILVLIAIYTCTLQISVDSFGLAALAICKSLVIECVSVCTLIDSF